MNEKAPQSWAGQCLLLLVPGERSAPSRSLSASVGGVYADFFIGHRAFAPWPDITTKPEWFHRGETKITHASGTHDLPRAYQDMSAWNKVRPFVICGVAAAALALLVSLALFDGARDFILGL
jgi:hypothetical protein